MSIYRTFSCRQIKKNLTKRQRKRSRMRSGGSSNKPPAGIERDSEAQGLEGESGIGKVFQSTSFYIVLI